MSSSHINSVIAVVPVQDHNAAVEWYTNLLGRSADVVPAEGVAEWQLVENAWLQVGTDPEQAGNATVIIGVNDIEAQCRALEEAKVQHGDLVEYPAMIKMVEVIDPSGNKLVFVQDISSGV